jgi:3-phosphoshikimate 1-carboxyvinyltransferase
MAMAFAIAALAADGPSTIDGADAVDISYPGFFDTLDALVDSGGYATQAGRLDGSRAD